MCPEPPRSTYRLQFRNGFDFDAAVKIFPYLSRLGISHVYASPLFQARSGSTHGYDTVDFNRIDDSLGGLDGFLRLVQALRAHDMGLILDVVPNHMGVGLENAWWHEVLEWGESSPFASFFDIDWDSGEDSGKRKVILPVLGDHVGRVVAAGELSFVLLPESGSLQLAYFEQRFPLAIRHYPAFLEGALGNLNGGAGDGDRSLIAMFEQAATPAEGAASKAALALRLKDDPKLLAAMDAVLDEMNQSGEEQMRAAALQELVDHQSYRLASWRIAGSAINYRRFFDINELVALRMEREEVFAASHKLLLQLIKDDQVQGVRLDHIDGLWDPIGYCRQLANAAASARGLPSPTVAQMREGRPIYLLAEKILAYDEPLRADLPVAGTTGYEFMNRAAGLFVNGSALPKFDDLWRSMSDDAPEIEVVSAAAKSLLLRTSFSGEMEKLVSNCMTLAAQSPSTSDFALADLRTALEELVIAMPIYRTYVTSNGATDADLCWLDRVFKHARHQSQVLDTSVFAFLQSVLSARLPEDNTSDPKAALQIAMRFQQLTSPIMAKAMEDTAFYRYARLISLNEVGGEPGVFGTTVDKFHRWMLARRTALPHTMLTTATHDHKRGEDTRLRIHALTEIPDAWAKTVASWQELNARRTSSSQGGSVPGPATAYIIYQTLVGIWPFEQKLNDKAGLESVADRLVAYMIKACREAKLDTSWVAPDEAYETELERFIRDLLDPAISSDFLADLAQFQQPVAAAAAISSLGLTLLRLTLPGVPDCYQGTELWDLSLVDPDNRRLVDYDARTCLLDAAQDIDTLLGSWKNGAVKLALMAATLDVRKREPVLFDQGDYLPLELSGACADHALAFARRHEGRTLITVAPRLIMQAVESNGRLALSPAFWEDTTVQLPQELRGDPFFDLLNDHKPVASGPSLPLSDLFLHLPLALLMR